MLRNFKLGTKITGGFIVIMLLTVSVAYIGWDSLQVVTDRFYKVDDIDCISKCILQARRHEKNFIIRGDKQWVDEVNKAMEKLKTTANNLKTRFNDPKNVQQMDAILAATTSYEKTFAAMVEFLSKPDVDKEERDKQLKVFDAALRDSGRDVEAVCSEAKNNHFEKLKSQIARANKLMIGGTLLAIGLGLFFAFVITRMITKPIDGVIEGLNAGSDQVADASTAVSTSSQTLAEGASEQAAAIEETSASLEELSAMTRKNADNATQTKGMMGEAKNIVEKASSELSHMISAVEEITKTSEKISNSVSKSKMKSRRQGRGDAGVFLIRQGVDCRGQRR